MSSSGSTEIVRETRSHNILLERKASTEIADGVSGEGRSAASERKERNRELRVVRESQRQSSISLQLLINNRRVNSI